MKMFRSFSKVFLFSTLLLIFLCPAFAQNQNASLSGQVLDAAGASIPGATVIVTNTSTNISHTTHSDSQGRYLVLELIPGTYQVSAESQGFNKKVLSGITLAVGQSATLNVPMQVGTQSTTVNVTTTAAVTNTETSSEGAVIGTRKVLGAPLNSRSFYSLALLVPGATLPAQNSTLGFRGGFNVSGNEETANTFTVNGIDDNDQQVMAPSFRPSVEAIQEFNLLTGVYSAEYGRTSGGQVVVVTKSGGNQFHGDAFEFIRNQVTDAKNFFTQAGTTPGFRRNQFGGILGGPIIKNRTFFFISYEGMRLAQEIAAFSTVPTLAERNGDFRAAGINVKNPYTKGSFTTPNVIDPGLISTYGKALMSEYPLPNNASPGANNYTFNESRIENMDEGGVRIDHKISDSDSLVGQFNYFNDPSFEPSNSLCGSSTLPGFGCTTNQTSTLAGINWVHILTPNLLNEFRVGYDRLVQPRLQQDYTQTSFPKLAGAFNDPSIANNFGVPDTSVTGFTSLAPYGNLPQDRWDNHYQIVDNVSWTHGGNLLKVGVNLLQARYSSIYVVDGRGALTFNSGSSASAGAPTTGNSLADLLVGLPYSTARQPSAPRLHTLFSSYGAYAQDNWRATSDLTLNLGVRWEYFSPVEDAANRLSTYDPTTQTMRVAGGPGVGRRIYNSDLNNWEPRVGLAWQPYHNSRTVLHASGGIFYNSPAIGNGATLNLQSNAPQRAPQTIFTTAAVPIQIDTNPFPAPPGCSPASIGVTPACPLTITPYGIQRNYRNMYVGEYAMDVQQQITPAMSLTIGYLGSQGSKLPNEVNLNQPVVVNGVSASTRPVPGVHSITYPSQHSYVYNNIFYYESEGKTHYDSMQVKLQQSYQHGLSLLLSYVWSKSVDTTPGYASTSNSSALLPQNSYNPAGERGRSDFNVAQRFVISPVYQLPFGKGTNHLTGRFASMLAGGWQLSGIGTVETGRPFTILNANLNNSGSFNNEDRPNLVGNPNSGPKTPAQWFNTSAFSTAVPKNTFGNAGRNIVTGPGYVDIDVALQRTFPITSRVSMPLRVESFNVANKPNFFNPTGPSLQAGTSSFGSITQANDPREMQFSVKLVF